jgi:quinol monooxygenase YgiN
MILASVTIIAGTGQREELRRALRSLLGPIRVEPGCLNCHLYEDVEQPEALTLVEEWATSTDVERRLRSDEYRLLLQLMESSPEPPRVVFHTVDQSQGLERVQQARLLVDSSPAIGRDRWNQQPA